MGNWQEYIRIPMPIQLVFEWALRGPFWKRLNQNKHCLIRNQGLIARAITMRCTSCVPS